MRTLWQAHEEPILYGGMIVQKIIPDLTQAQHQISGFPFPEVLQNGLIPFLGKVGTVPQHGQQIVDGLSVSGGIVNDHPSLRRKDREILYRDELFEKLSRNVDDVFLMLDPGAKRVDYVSPNAERLLGLPAEVIKTDVRILDRLNPENQRTQKNDCLEGLQKNEQREFDTIDSVIAELEAKLG